MKKFLYTFFELAIKTVAVSLFIFIMYWAMTFLYEAAKAIFK